MNAGCYGTYTADVFVAARAVTRQGRVVTLAHADMGFAYRATALPEGMVLTEVELAGPRGEPAALAARMEAALARRDATQPTQGALGRVDLPQPGRVLLHRPRRTTCTTSRPGS